MFPCSAPQKPDGEHSFFLTGQDTNWEMQRCLFKNANPSSLVRLKQDLFMVHVFGSSPLSCSSHTFTVKRMLRKGSSPVVSGISLFPCCFYVQSKTISPSTVPLRTCACLPLPHLHATCVSWPTTSPLPCLISSLLWKQFLSFCQSSLHLCYSTPWSYLTSYPLLQPCLTQRAWFLSLAELCLKHRGESLEAVRAKLTSSTINFHLVVRSKRPFYHTWITGIHRHHLRGRQWGDTPPVSGVAVKCPLKIV